MGQRKSVTLKDIAQQTGVSVVTVSKVLNSNEEGAAGMQTVKRIYDVAQQLGYRRSDGIDVFTKEKITVGILLVPECRNVSAHPFYNDIYTAIKEAADAENINIDFFYPFYEVNENSFIRNRIIESKIDNLIIIGGVTDEFNRYFKNIVNISFNRFLAPNQSNIRFGLYEVAKEAIQYLLDSGRKKILFFGGGRTREGMISNDDAWRNNIETDSRSLAFVDVHLENGLEISSDIVYDADFMPEKLTRLLTQRLQNNPLDFDAVFAGDDMMGMACIKVLQEHNIRVPEDVAVIGVNNEEFCRYMVPPLATIEHNHKAAGVLAVEILRIKSKYPMIPNFNVSLPCKFIKRRSCGV